MNISNFPVMHFPCSVKKSMVTVPEKCLNVKKVTDFLISDVFGKKSFKKCYITLIYLMVEYRLNQN